MENKPLSRRTLLKGGVVALGAEMTLVGFDELFGYRRVFGQSDGDDPATILNLAATAETLAVTHYYNVLTASTIPLTPAEQNYFKSALDAELKHLEYLNANGGKALAAEFYFPNNVYDDRQQFSEITETAERVFVAAYLAAVRRVAELGNSLLAAAAAQIAVTEQVHLALIRQIGGRIPNHVSLGQALLYNTSEAGPVFQPFLEAGEGRKGPGKFPGADAVRDVIGDVGVLLVKPFTDQDLLKAVQPSAAGECRAATAGRTRVNIRSDAGIDFAIVGKLMPGQLLPVNGQRADKDGFVWYQLTQGGFVRSDVVSTTGNCTSLTRI
jgi:hypothetical protein